MSPATTARRIERRLASEGLAPLDYDDGAGGITVGNRGSGKLLDASRAFARRMSAEEVERRKALFSERDVMSLDEQRVYKLYAKGMGNRRIARHTGLGRMTVFRIVKRFEARLQPDRSFAELVAACEPTVLVLFFALLERALTEPREIAALIGKARSVPEIRALVEPEEHDG